MNRLLPACFAALFISSSTISAADPVTALVYEPKGERLYAGGRGIVVVTHAKTHARIGEFVGLTGRVTGLALNSTGLLAIAHGEPGKTGLLRIDDLQDTKSLPSKTIEVAAHKDTIYAIVFSPDGKTLATAGYDRLIHLWDVPFKAKPEPRLTLKDHSDAIYALAFHPNGKLLASGSADRSVKVWDVSNGKRLYTLSDPIDWVYAVAWSPNGQQLAAAGADKSLRTWDVNEAGGKLTNAAFAHEKTVTKVLYSPKGDRIYTVGDDRAIKAWEPSKLKELLTWKAPPSAILAAALTPDGTQLAVAQYDGRVSVYDASTGRVVALDVPREPRPSIESLSTDSVARGQTSRITLKGTELHRIVRFDCSAETVSLRIVDKKPTQLELEITVAKDAPLGSAPIVPSSSRMATKPISLFIDRFPAIAERGSTDSARDGMAIRLPATVVGALDRSGDSDFFRFEAAAGQEVGVQVQTTLNDATKFDPVLTLTDSAGRVLAEGTNGVLGYKVPTAGTYAIAVRDREFRGGAGMTYRLHVGPVPVITSVFPLGIPASGTHAVRLIGVNLGTVAESTFAMTAKDPSDVGKMLAVPVVRSGGDPVGKAEVAIGEYPARTYSTLPQDRPMTPPMSVDGVLAKPHDTHAIAFIAKKGQPLLIETHAARLGSPVDSSLEILDEKQRPVARAVLRSVAKTNVTFRDHTSDSPGIRMDAWNEFAIDDTLYVGGELMRILALPKGPDDDCQFYQSAGKRRSFLDTTPTYHALNTPMYKVEFHPPGSTFPPNGLPTFTQFTRNDDGGPGYGKDSCLHFDPPADGTYTAVVRDANGDGGPSHAYRLTVRTPRPEFAIRVDSPTWKVWKDGSLPVAVTATRTDGFAGPIAVKFDGLPKGYTVPATVIEAGQDSTVVALTASPTAGEGGPITVRGTATIDGRAVVHSTAATIAKPTEPGDIGTTTNVAEFAIRPGTETRIVVKIERRNGFAGRVPVEVRGLPHGVRVLNIGLSGILILPTATEREIVFYAEPWVAPMERPIVVLAKREGKGTEHAAPSVVVKVQK